jgi:flagellar biosynthesis/type III secretory pathway M-ring protein FliF/YscJ
MVGASHAQEDVVGLIEKQPQEVAVLLRSWLADRR